LNSTIYFNKPFKWLNSEFYFKFNEENNEFLNFTGGGLNLFLNKKKRNYLTEIGFKIEGYNYISNSEFSHISATSYFLYKHFYKAAALNIELDLSVRNFRNSNISDIYLTRLSSHNYFSVPIKDNIGLQTGIFVNTNLIKTDSLIYNDLELFDYFSYDMYNIYTGLTIYAKKLLIKPKLTFSLKRYLAISDKKPYNESSIFFDFYCDYPLLNNLLVFTDSFYQTALSTLSTENAYNFSVGLIYKF